MFYTLSKLLDLAVAPLAWAIALVVLSVAFASSRPRVSRIAGALAVAVLVVFSAPRTSNYLQELAERGAPRTYDPAVTYDAVVVLTGILDTEPTRRTHELQFNGGVERLLAGWDLVRSGHAKAVFISGENEAELLRAQLVAWGVTPARISVEGVSRNTHENAVETKKAVQRNGWRRILLVTSAAHMNRALGCFRHEGLTPDTLPVDYRAGADDGGSQLLPREDALGRSARALREFLGRLAYRVVGYSAP